MSNTALPKGEQTAYQRWELTSFGEKRQSHLERAETVEKISQTELSAIKEAAHKAAYEVAYAVAYEDAYTLAYEEGKAIGYQEMQAKGLLLLQDIIDVKNAFDQQLMQAHVHVGAELVNLAIDLASTMTGIQFDLHPDTIIPIVHEAINLLPSVQQPAHLILHPEDLAIVTSILGEQLQQAGWRFISDPHLARGGCRIETPENLVDATYASRWARLTELLVTTELAQAPQALQATLPVEEMPTAQTDSIAPP